MGEHYRSLSAVFPVILNEDGTKILLHRRENTGYQDGRWDIAASGHVDEGETASQAVVRECKEEIGVDVSVADARFIHLSHRLGQERTYYDIYFLIRRYEGEPRIMEAMKCSELAWFALNALPEEMIRCRQDVVEAWQRGECYSERME